MGTHSRRKLYFSSERIRVGTCRCGSNILEIYIYPHREWHFDGHMQYVDVNVFLFGKEPALDTSVRLFPAFPVSDLLITNKMNLYCYLNHPKVSCAIAEGVAPSRRTCHQLNLKGTEYARNKIVSEGKPVWRRMLYVFIELSTHARRKICFAKLALFYNYQFWGHLPEVVQTLATNVKEKDYLVVFSQSAEVNESWRKKACDRL